MVDFPWLCFGGGPKPCNSRQTFFFGDMKGTMNEPSDYQVLQCLDRAQATVKKFCTAWDV